MTPSPESDARAAAELEPGALASGTSWRPASTGRDASPRERAARWIAAAAAAAVLVAGLVWGTHAVGGSDSHCYVGQARMFLDGRASLPPPLPGPVSWPNAPATFVPSGFANAAGTPNAVPLCPAGLSLLMAVPMIVNSQGWILVVPLLGALAVWSTYLLGRRLAGDAVGAGAALLLSVSPIFLYQLFQPMSDVPATAFWAASLAAAAQDPARRRGPVASGVLTGLGIMMRPNLAPLAAVPVLLAMAAAPAGRRWRSALSVVAGALPGIMAVAALQAAIYGSPLRSGYGALSGLFSASHVTANLARYPAWLADAHGLVLVLAFAAPFVARSAVRTWLLVGFCLATLGLYLPYVVFDDWWYTRFLLPALPALVVLVVTVARAAAQRLPRAARAAAFGLVVVAIGAWWGHRADELGVFRIRALERKYPELGRFAAQQLPTTAVVLAAQPTGAIRHYAKLPTLSWDAIEPAWLDRTVADLRARGLEPYLAIEAWERDAYRERFGTASTLGQLDWPPRAQIGRAIALYRLDDRPRYLAGERIPTTRIPLPAR